MELSTWGRLRAGIWPELPPILIPAEAARKLAASLPRFVEHLFLVAMCLIGDDEARALFRKVAKKKYKKKRGMRGKGKEIDPRRDKILLMTYDNALKTCLPGDHQNLVGDVSRKLHEASATRLGDNAGAIATQLRRLLKRRELRAAERQTHLLDKSPTLLSGISRDKK